MHVLANRIMSDDLWEIVEQLLPSHPQRPQGGGKRRMSDRTIFVAVAYMVTTDTPWARIPSWLGVTSPTAHRRYTQWTEAGLWETLHSVGTNLPSTWLCEIAVAAQYRSTIKPGPRQGFVESEPTIVESEPTTVDVINDRVAVRN